ncbi:uncharacterized protein N7511_004353 [Penicillium nucicola]|uniref:uncharacterized protein n=1 Tax=Penicillium nucicola TaxID=1850975 RepID=UPI002545BAF5|nr:uncharacterized protein N7511_004353 [Penicillium nucicola]KAJ5766737.1 hypothetical protein N7511_004353 [Penicillium nucicola]
MKYTLQTCIFTHQTNPALSACNSSCNPLEKNLNTLWGKGGGKWAPQYQYCQTDDASLVQYQGGCASCLEKQDNTKVLGNFLGAMGSACDSKPNATKDETVSLSQSLFTLTSTSPSPSSSSSPSSSPSTTSNSGLSSGAKIGIGIGVGVGVTALGVMAGIVWFCIRRRRAQPQSGSYMAPPETQSFSEHTTQQNYVPELPTSDPKGQQPTEIGGKQVVAELPGHMSS